MKLKLAEDFLVHYLNAAFLFLFIAMVLANLI